MTDDDEAPPSRGGYGPDRRAFLNRMSLALSGLIGAAIGVPVIGFLLAPLFEASPRDWRPVGKVDAFRIGATIEVSFTDPSALPWAGLTAKMAAYLRRESASAFMAYAVNCTHLGCPVRWEERSTLFLCPCHGGVYYKDGTVAAGPPPNPLQKYPVRVRNGQVEIRTSPVAITRSV